MRDRNHTEAIKRCEEIPLNPLIERGKFWHAIHTVTV